MSGAANENDEYFETLPSYTRFQAERVRPWVKSAVVQRSTADFEYICLRNGN